MSSENQPDVVAQRKNKNSPVGAIRYWWNLMLFARGFEFEVDAPADHVAQQLAQIEIPPDTMPVFEKRVGEMTTSPDEHTQAHNFDLRVARIQIRGTLPTVTATGRVIYSQGYGTTIVRGLIRLGVAYYFIILIGLIGGLFGLLTVLEQGMATTAITGILTSLVSLYTAYTIRDDYRLLMRHVVDNAAQAALENDNDSLPPAVVDYDEIINQQTASR